MLNKELILTLLLIPLVLTRENVIEFTGTLTGEFAKVIERQCTNPASEHCQILLKEVCKSVWEQVGQNTIEGEKQCTTSILEDRNYIDVRLVFINPKVDGTSVDLECGVFPSLLKIAVTNSQNIYSLGFQNVTLIRPKPQEFELAEDIVKFEVTVGFLIDEKPIQPGGLNETVKRLVAESLKSMVSQNAFTYPLYPIENKTLSLIHYRYNGSIDVGFRVEYKSVYLQNTGLNPTCTEFNAFLGYGLLHENDKKRVTLRPPITVRLISDITFKTTTVITSSTTTAPVTTVQTTVSLTGTGNKLVYQNCITWIGLFMAHLIEAI